MKIRNVYYVYTFLQNAHTFQNFRAQSQFKINESTGDISCTNCLDYETVTHYELLVEARDHGNPTRRKNKTVVINIVDVNDNAPQFRNMNGNLTIR